MQTFKLYSTAQMREAERRAESEYGISLAALMDNAGNSLACTALDMKPGNRVDIFCGKGNNGGDGYVCAAALLRHGVNVTVWGIGRGELSGDSLAGAAADAFEAAGSVVRPYTMDVTGVTADCALIIDALFGTGLARPLDGLYVHAVCVINASGRPVLSCDLPSGVDADTGRIMGAAVRADRTLMLGLAKPACALPPGSGCFGELLLGDIGLPQELVTQFEPIQGI